MKTRFLQGDCVEQMRELPMESIDAVVTDPPYDLTSNKKGGSGTASVNLDTPYGRSRIGTGNGPGGFMGHTWDSTGVAFDVSTWNEVRNTLKPGGHLLAFGGTRTYHRMVCAIEDAGFEIRDCLMWLYGQGFPKSLNLEGGLGTNLKPAWEPIVLARKPLEGTVEECVTSYGTGVLNIDASKIGAEDGRWPSNLLLTHHPDCVQSGTTMAPGRNMNRYTDGLKPFGGGVGHPHESTTLPNEEIEVWDCVPDCPIGGIGEEARFFYCPKVSALERNAGLEGFEAVAAGGMEGRNDGSMGSVTYSRNHHPTVKPVDLMRYLVRLVTPPHGTVMDPFMGSGSTGIAAYLEGRSFLGIEQDKEYMRIAKARVAHWAEHGENTMAVSASERTREKIRETGQLDVFGVL